jgi:hypothetical protein
MAESILRFKYSNANRIIKEHKKFFNRNYKKIKVGPNLYKLVEFKKGLGVHNGFS